MFDLILKHLRAASLGYLMSSTRLRRRLRSKSNSCHLDLYALAMVHVKVHNRRVPAVHVREAGDQERGDHELGVNHDAREDNVRDVGLGVLPDGSNHRLLLELYREKKGHNMSLRTFSIYIVI